MPAPRPDTGRPDVLRARLDGPRSPAHDHGREIGGGWISLGDGWTRTSYWNTSPLRLRSGVTRGGQRHQLTRPPNGLD
jgi:hypothetical protein